MFKSWGTWLGIESTSGQKTDQIQSEETSGSDKDEENSGVNKPDNTERNDENQAVLQQNKGLSAVISLLASTSLINRSGK
ncbi:synapse-associated protein 1 isoform X1 [Tachysurus ichikawai]